MALLARGDVGTRQRHADAMGLGVDLQGLLEQFHRVFVALLDQVSLRQRVHQGRVARRELVGFLGVRQGPRDAALQLQPRDVVQRPRVGRLELENVLVEPFRGGVVLGRQLVLLSGLYGVLRPLDRLQPYRLEMGTALANPRGRDLYAWWGDTVADYLNERLAGERSRTIVNLASIEYAKVALRPALNARVVDCVFEDWKDGRYKIISFFAKRARGLMARHAVQVRARSVKALESFDSDGYALAPTVSEPDRLVFRRRV